MPDNFMQSYVSGYAAGEYLKWGAAAAKQKTELDNEKLGLEVKASENELDAYTKQATLAKLAAEPPKPGELPKGAVEIQTDYRDRLAQAGFVVASLDVEKKLYDNQKVVSDIQDKTLERATQGYARLVREMPTIHNDAEWKAFGRDQQALYPEAVAGSEQYMRTQALFDTPWTPELTDRMYRGAVTKLDEIKQQKEQAEVTRIQAETRKTEVEIKQLPIKLEQSERRTAAVVKAYGLRGTSAGKPPSPTLVNAVADRILVDFSGTDPADARVRARPIATTAKALMDDGTPMDEAINLAYKAAKVGSEAQLGGLKPSHAREGQSRFNPIPVSKAQLSASSATWKKSTPEEKKQGIVIPNKFYSVDGVLHVAIDQYRLKPVTELKDEPASIEPPPIPSESGEE